MKNTRVVKKKWKCLAPHCQTMLDISNNTFYPFIPLSYLQRVSILMFWIYFCEIMCNVFKILLKSVIYTKFCMLLNDASTFFKHEILKKEINFKHQTYHIYDNFGIINFINDLCLKFLNGKSKKQLKVLFVFMR